jgi:3-methyladenine DNA glycosylase AlkD
MDAREAASAARKVVASYRGGDPVRTADGLREIWMKAAPTAGPELESRQAGVLRDWGIKDPHFEAAGTPVPILRAIGSEVGKLGRKHLAAFLPLVQLLWEKYGREGRLVAAVALGPMELLDPERVVPFIHDLARTCIFWEDCDQLAMKALEPVLRRDPDGWLEPLGRWVSEENKWVRRAAMTAIGRLPMVHSEYAARCIALVSPALGDSDTDVKRALSFAVRVCARGDVEPVKQFVLDHRQASDPDSLWVLCDVVRSMTPAFLPEFVELRPVYEAWLEMVGPKARRSVEGAIRVLDRVEAT